MTDSYSSSTPGVEQLWLAGCVSSAEEFRPARGHVDTALLMTRPVTAQVLAVQSAVPGRLPTDYPHTHLSREAYSFPGGPE
jgi:hypothetical protein